MTHPATATAVNEIFATIIDGGDYREMDRYFTSDYIDHSAVWQVHLVASFGGEFMDRATSAPPS